MRLLFTFLVVYLCVSFSLAQKITYNLSMPNPESHYFNVEMLLNDFKEEEIVVSLPVWAPGSYLVREFAKNVNLVKAYDDNGNELKVEKTRKNKWKIDKSETKNVKVVYQYYAFELTVRTSFLDKTHGYINGTNVFMYPETLNGRDYKDLKGVLNIQLPEIFSNVSTILKKNPEGMANDSNAQSFVFSNYDELGDSPIEIGNHEEFSFMAAGVKHRVAMYGPGNYDVERLKVDMAKVVESTTNVYGQNPNDEYLFIIHNTKVGSGGLEHMSSTTLNVNRWTYQGTDYLKFLSLVAHEYFHLWHVKRLRPDVLGPFDYDNENYTDLLWVMEGFTSYYDELILRRAGFYSEEAYVRQLINTLNFVENNPGTRVQPVAHASFDAWIKAYRPDENSRNTTISYYSKGHLIAAAIDVLIIEKFKGKKSLDDFLQFMYNKYFVEDNRGFSSEEFKSDLEGFTKMNFDKFFNDYVYGTVPLNFSEIFSKIGFKINESNRRSLTFGVSTADENGKLMVRNVIVNSAAEKSGLSPNDEIIAFNGFRVNNRTFSSFMNGLNKEEEFVLIISRDDQLMVINGKMEESTSVRYDFENDFSNKLTKFWLRTDQ